MDESAYRFTRGHINREPCVFEKALLARCAVCELEVRHALAERETVECSNQEARRQCARLKELLRENSAFALKLTDPHALLPHAAMMRIQCGGLNGMKDLLDGDALAPSVRRLVMLARQQPGGMEELPWFRVVQGVSAWKIRKRHGPKGDI